MEAGIHLIAPTLLFYEVINALYQYRKHDYIDNDALEIAVATALALPVEVMSPAGIHRRAVTLAAQLRLPATYDAHYLALADHAGVDLWTGDKRLAAAAHENGLAWVHLHTLPPSGNENAFPE